MGMLVEGTWHDVWYDTKASKGRFLRSEAQFRNWVTRDGSPGPSGKGGFRAEPGRYHLYVSLACPWAHRTLIFRTLKGLEPMISLSAVNSFMGTEGWTFEPGPGVIPDAVNGAARVYEVYLAADPRYSGRATVPILWDKQQNTIASNESKEIIRMLNSAFDDVGAAGPDYYPAPLRGEIDELNERIYHTVNNGVYKSGFATTQEAYEEAVTALFETLDMLEERLATRRYLVGSEITEADWRLWTTLVRFDPVYFGHFKCNVRRIVDYPNLWGYTCDLYQQPGIAETVDIAYIQAHYYGSHESINPHRILPVGPEIDYSVPHDRARLGN
ncbi:glutathione S-transferase family protein [Candidatus Rariloculus sp.]|uniref:glutathione S-transferase family protein n=1 Tax=Candidatus Rariloculus sp. TaxID=3101265 RepID=UPI003D0FE2C3